MTGEEIVASLRRAVDAAPDDVPLRLHLAELLLAGGATDEAIRHAAAALEREPSSEAARALMARAVGAPPPAPPDPAPDPEPPAAGDVDWAKLESDFDGVVPPMFVTADADPAAGAPAEGPDAYDVDRSTIRLADVGGMAEVKQRLEAAFLVPMRNPELQRLYGKSLRGGLLLYGPPGCGKTFIARAVAGELGASFLAVSLADVLDMYVGQSERNLRDVFEIARRNAPCVVFLDEVDAIGQKRSNLRHSPAMRSTVNQLLHELDGVSAANEGVFVLAATNAPWDVDAALRRPGRLDRMLLVVPPDDAAREAVLRYHLRDRPIANVDVAELAKLTDGFSGADLAHLCESAAEAALMESARTGRVRMIGMDDLRAARRDIRPSTGAWYELVRNVALFANEGGHYDDLLAHLRQRRIV